MAKLDDTSESVIHVAIAVLNLNKWLAELLLRLYGMERARLLPQQTDFIQFESVLGIKSLQLTNIRTESIREIITTF